MKTCFAVDIVDSIMTRFPCPSNPPSPPPPSLSLSLSLSSLSLSPPPPPPLSLSLSLSLYLKPLSVKYSSKHKNPALESSNPLSTCLNNLVLANINSQTNDPSQIMYFIERKRLHDNLSSCCSAAEATEK